MNLNSVFVHLDGLIFAERVQVYTDLSIKGSLPFFTNNATLDMINHYAVLMYKFAGPDLCKTIFDTPGAKNLKNTKKIYDILITTILGNDCMLGFAHHFKIPSVGIIPTVDLPWASDMVGLPDNPSYIPNHLTAYSPKMTLIERTLNTITYFLVKTGYSIFSVDQSNSYVREFFGKDTPDLRVLANNFSLILANSHFSLHQSKPFVPNYVEIGGLHIEQRKPLPKHLEDAVSSYPNGTIYVSFGSMMMSEFFSVYKLQAIYDVLGELPYKILWKGDKEKLPKNLKIPTNIQYEKWMPQLDLLCHPKVKLFISHGGLMSTLESVHCGMPVLGIPLFADQDLNIANSVNKFLAIKVAYNNITKKSILYAAKQLLQNPLYKSNVKKASDLFKDRPMTPLDTAVYWIEYVVRYKGAPHLRSVGADLHFYQYFLLDVAAVILTTTMIVPIFVYYLIGIIYNAVARRTLKVKIN